MPTLLGWGWSGLVLLSSGLFVWMIRWCQEFVPDIGSARSGALGLLLPLFVAWTWWTFLSLVNGLLWVSTMPKSGALRYVWMPLLILAGSGLVIVLFFLLLDKIVTPYASIPERQNGVILLGMLNGAIVLLNLFWLWRFHS